MKFKQAIDIIEKIAPLEYGESWDNSGIQINCDNGEIKKVMFCLEINDEVIEEATSKSVDLIVTHHPLLFNRPDKIDINEVIGRYIIKLINAKISVYSAHITFDNAPLGNNYYLAKLLELKNIEDVPDYTGVTGYLPTTLKFKDAIDYVQDALDLPDHYIRAVGSDSMEIDKVAICTGAGGDLLYKTEDLDCQMVITGDVKLNVAADAKAMGIALIDAGHYGTEKIFSENFLEQFKEILEKMDNTSEVTLIVSEANTNPFIEN